MGCLLHWVIEMLLVKTDNANRADMVDQIEKLPLGSVVEVSAIVECTKYEKGWFTKLRTIGLKTMPEIAYNNQPAA